MWKCPICSNEENGIYICQKCGYDKRKDFVRQRTVSSVPQMDADALAKLISANDAEELAKAAAAQALLEAMKREQEKKAEEERKAKEAAEAARIVAMRRVEEARRADVERRAEETRRLMSYRSELEKQREVQRKGEEDREIYEALLKNANITEETLTRYERTVLFQICSEGLISLAQTTLDGYIEKHRKEALEKEQAKSEVKNSTVMETSKVSSSTKADKEKKTPIVFKLGIGFAIIGLSVFAGQSFKNSAKEPYASEQMNALWKSIEQASIDALSSEMIDYEALTMEDLGAELASYGCTVNGPEWFSSEEDEIKYSLDLEAALKNEETTYYQIICLEGYLEDMEKPYRRSLNFNKGTFKDEEANESMDMMFNAIVPLPMGIQFGDSFKDICAKLGITEANIADGDYYDADSGLFVVYENDGWLHLMGEKYDFVFICDEEDNTLVNYWIDIYYE